MCATLSMAGVAVGDFDSFSYGMLINYLYEYDRIKRRARGENVPDPEEQYRRLKKLQPLILRKLEKGEITPERYARWVTPIRQYEGW